MEQTLLQSVDAAEMVFEQALYWMVCHCLSGSSSGSNLEFVQGTGDSLSTLREGHRDVRKSL